MQEYVFEHKLDGDFLNIYSYCNNFGNRLSISSIDNFRKIVNTNVYIRNNVIKHLETEMPKFIKIFNEFKEYLERYEFGICLDVSHYDKERSLKFYTDFEGYDLKPYYRDNYESKHGSIESKFIDYYINNFHETIIDNSEEYKLEKGDLFELAYYNINYYDYQKYGDIKFDFENMDGKEMLRKILNYVDYYIDKNSNK